MGINRDKPDLWKTDIAKSADLHGSWFMDFSQIALQEARKTAFSRAEEALVRTNCMQNLSAGILKKHPSILQTLRMSTYSQIAADKLADLSGVSRSFVRTIENAAGELLPVGKSADKLEKSLTKIVSTIKDLTDLDVFPWLQDGTHPSDDAVRQSSSCIAERLCKLLAANSMAETQKKRQYSRIAEFLEGYGYSRVSGSDACHSTMPPGTYAFDINLPVYSNSGKKTYISIDAAIKLFSSSPEDLPVFIQAKFADNPARICRQHKEEAKRMRLLKDRFGDSVSYILCLCGHFDARYLGYAAAEGIDWIWEHRMEDLTLLELQTK